MRMMLRFRFPADAGNEVIRSGKIEQILGGFVQDLKPEAAYFYPDGGQRGGIVVFDMKDPSQLVDVAEPLWFGLHAEVECVPVMSGDDLQKGLSRIPGIVQKYG